MQKCGSICSNIWNEFGCIFFSDACTLCAYIQLYIHIYNLNRACICYVSCSRDDDRRSNISTLLYTYILIYTIYVWYISVVCSHAAYDVCIWHTYYIDCVNGLLYNIKHIGSMDLRWVHGMMAYRKHQISFAYHIFCHLFLCDHL